jgi:hypothetical protein
LKKTEFVVFQDSDAVPHETDDAVDAVQQTNGVATGADAMQDTGVNDSATLDDVPELPSGAKKTPHGRHNGHKKVEVDEGVVFESSVKKFLVVEGKS